MKIRIKIIILLTFFTSQSCMNFSSLQTARTTPPGKGKQLFGIGGYSKIDPQQKTTNNNISKIKDIKGISVQGHYRKGLNDWIDFGVEPLGNLGIGLDLKFQTINLNYFASAFSIGGGGLGLASNKNIDNLKENDALLTPTTNVSFSWHNSIHFKDFLSIYITPKGFHYSSKDEENNYLMLIGGISLFNRIFVEGAYGYEKRDPDTKIRQISTGMLSGDFFSFF